VGGGGMVVISTDTAMSVAETDYMENPLLRAIKTFALLAVRLGPGE
jgi:hypothetical protein